LKPVTVSEIQPKPILIAYIIQNSKYLCMRWVHCILPTTKQGWCYLPKNTPKPSWS